MESDAPEAPLGHFGCSRGAPGPFWTLLRHPRGVSDAPEPFRVLPRCPRAVLDASEAPCGHAEGAVGTLKVLRTR